MSEPPQSRASDAPPLLLCNLLYAAPPHISSELVRSRIATALPSARVVSKAEEQGAILIAHTDHIFEFKDGKKMPALTAVAEGNPVEASKFEDALRQTWDWPEARAAATKATHQIAVFEMMSRVFSPSARVEMFYSMLLQLLEIAPPLAIHCHHAERMLDPFRVVRASGAVDSFPRMMLFLNVRLFRIENGQFGEILMDTRGLAALQLPDLQIHFRNLEPRRVASLLYDTANYVFSRGDCIKDGNTVQGLSPDQKWKCQHEMSILPPKRLVIDIDPGDPFAAGKRSR